MHGDAIDPPRTFPAAGDLIAGRFVVEHVIGSGAMGVVVAARSLLLKRRVAIKLVTTGAMHAFPRFEREAIALASLDNDHIVKVLEYGQGDEGAPYLVMEFLVGTDLQAELRQRGRLPLDEAADCVLEACVGLAAAHSRGIVHRDIKPANLFLAQRPGEGPRVKLLDFGISKFLDDDASAQELTQSAATIGSPGYMSPEQVRRAKTVDHRTDIWSLGVVLYRLLTGTQPFVAESFGAMCVAVVNDVPRPVRQERPEIPLLLEAATMRCLEKEPGLRFPSVHELGAALAPFASKRGERAAERLRASTAMAGSNVYTVTVDAPTPGVICPESSASDAARESAPPTEPTARSQRKRRLLTAAVGLTVAAGAGTLLFTAPQSTAKNEAALTGDSAISPSERPTVAKLPATSAIAPPTADERPGPSAPPADAAAWRPAPEAAPRGAALRPSVVAPRPSAGKGPPPPTSFGGDALRSRE